jgi:hypothetical protein
MYFGTPLRIQFILQNSRYTGGVDVPAAAKKIKMILVLPARSDRKSNFLVKHPSMISGCDSQLPK